ncbi:CpsB/CapC family capsule biosynthesis tyrosine phosphatase [Parapedobacter lycopersici]|uniref:CpsB/CapC family capsule biosynthesis tyrosine phosphatase n=1 Tax=Parapedobacter lycopersici TaxID=1864939 RepID=UPI00214D6FE4|nr:CpsB/CapC family capsule biosynthesis tyrosine phosphatase [Parapedobacter lycopersici]
MFILKAKQPFPVNRATTVDLRAQLLPGIAGGPAHLDSATALVQGLTALGYRHLITTPQLRGPDYRLADQAIQQAAIQLQQHVDQHGIIVSITPAAEYCIGEGFEEFVRQHSIRALPGNYVLLDISNHESVRDLKGPLFELRARGYEPVIVQPENLPDLIRSMAALEYLRDLGCFFQVNLLSLVGHYGRRASSFATKLLKAGYVDFLGSNVRNLQDLFLLQTFAVTPTIGTLLEQTKFKNGELVFSEISK